MKVKRFSRVLDRHWWPAFPDEKPPESAWDMIDVDEYWEFVRSQDLESDLINRLTERRFWRITFRHMNHGLGKGVFKNAFFHPDAEREREIAIGGLSQTRRSGLMELVKAARVFTKTDLDRMLAEMPALDGEDEFEPTPFLCNEEGREWDAEMIARSFAHYIVNPPPLAARKTSKKKSRLPKQPHPLKVLAQHLNSIANAEETLERRRNELVRSGCSKRVGLTLKGTMWRVFCKELVRKGELPTAFELKEAMRLETGSCVDETYFETMCNSLGLSWIKSLE